MLKAMKKIIFKNFLFTNFNQRDDIFNYIAVH